MILRSPSGRRPRAARFEDRRRVDFRPIARAGVRSATAVSCVLIVLLSFFQKEFGAQELVSSSSDITVELAGSVSFRANTVTMNTGGTVTGGIDMGANSCEGAASCP